jgi:hypothetical protein
MALGSVAPKSSLLGATDLGFVRSVLQLTDCSVFDRELVSGSAEDNHGGFMAIGLPKKCS